MNDDSATTAVDRKSKGWRMSDGNATKMVWGKELLLN